MNHQQFKSILSVLPPVKKFKARGEAHLYGISNIIAKMLKLPFTPRSIPGWKHGWLFGDLEYKEQLTGGNSYPLYLVPLKEHQRFLEKHNIDSDAVGMPFIYIEDFDTKEITRQKNSLLVMPPHSLPFTEHSFDEESYAKQINNLKKDFDLIVLCIHQSCVEKQLWIKAFEKYDIPWIIGADSQDENALIRMYRIFKSFEYMTTNAIGSHIVYASYCGCKVSIFGDFLEYSIADFKNDTAYQKLPFLLEHNLKNATKKSIEQKFPFLFSSPKDAQKKVEWAETELGKKNKVSLKELTKLLGWTPIDQTKLFFNRKLKKVSASLKKLK